jgi:trehalose/maltose hydrolase-like predicted phosphorylase
MSDHHLCALVYEITPLNYSAPITIRSSLDGNVQNHGVPRYRQLTSKHWNLIHSETTQDGIHLHVQTTHSKYDLVMYAKTSLQEDCNFIEPEKDVFQDKFKIGEEIQFYAQENSTYALEKIVSVATSLDLETEDYEGLARQKLDSVSSFAQIYEPHIRAWKNLWNKADIQIEGDRFTQRTIRLHIFHLLVTASLHNTEIDAGMPARGLHGEAYRGHIFWDEVYILPFYDLHYPQIVRALLMYRYNRLNAARQYARDNGYEGAMYPWQTADGGDEETQEVHYNPESKTWGPDLSRNQRHISLAVFYNIWRYMKIAQDEEFLHTYGAEIMLEIARCFASMAEYDSETGKYHIDGVMGPDEFHEKFPGREKAGLKDNAYTNVMTSWALEKTVDVLQQLPEEVLKKLESKNGFKQEELQKWKEVSENLNVIIDENNVISQFEGYMDLKELDWEDYRQRYYSIHRMDRILKAEGDSPDNYKVAKQADVLMMFYLLKPEEVKRILNKLGYEIEDAYELLTANYNYYEPRTSHGSTLSKVVHSVVSSFIHVDERPWNWFLEAMQSDIYDTQGGTTQEGIHTGVMAGTIDVILRSFARLDYLKSTVSINPRLPEQWISLMFKILHQDVWYQFEVNKKYVRVRADAETTEPTTVKVLNKEITLQPGVWNEIGSSCPFIPFTISNY